MVSYKVQSIFCHQPVVGQVSRFSRFRSLFCRHLPLFHMYQGLVLSGKQYPIQHGRYIGMGIAFYVIQHHETRFRASTLHQLFILLYGRNTFRKVATGRITHIRGLNHCFLRFFFHVRCMGSRKKHGRVNFFVTTYFAQTLQIVIHFICHKNHNVEVLDIMSLYGLHRYMNIECSRVLENSFHVNKKTRLITKGLAQ